MKEEELNELADEYTCLIHGQSDRMTKLILKMLIKLVESNVKCKIRNQIDKMCMWHLIKNDIF